MLAQEHIYALSADLSFFSQQTEIIKKYSQALGVSERQLWRYVKQVAGHFDDEDEDEDEDNDGKQDRIHEALLWHVDGCIIQFAWAMASSDQKLKMGCLTNRGACG